MGNRVKKEVFDPATRWCGPIPVSMMSSYPAIQGHGAQNQTTTYDYDDHGYLTGDHDRSATRHQRLRCYEPARTGADPNNGVTRTVRRQGTGLQAITEPANQKTSYVNDSLTI